MIFLQFCFQNRKLVAKDFLHFGFLFLSNDHLAVSLEQEVQHVHKRLVRHQLGTWLTHTKITVKMGTRESSCLPKWHEQIKL